MSLRELCLAIMVFKPIIIPCSPNTVTVRDCTRLLKIKKKKQPENGLFLPKKSERILDILWAFLIKQLFHSRLLDMR